MLACLAAGFLTSTSSAGTIDIGDGKLSDWGVRLRRNPSKPNFDRLKFKFSDVDGNALPTDFGNTDFTGTGTYNGFKFQYFIEDQDDSAGTGSYLGPHSGGQDYDAEFMGVGVQDGQLVIGIATGQRTDNGASKFAPGDIFIETADGVFAIEVGKGGTNVGGDPVDPGTTYTLTDKGFTISESEDSTSVVAGSVWANPLTSASPIDGVATQVLGGDYIGQALYNYSMPSNSEHAFIEVAVPLDFFGITTIESVRWAPACNNDIVATTDMHLSTVPTPGSATLLLIGTGGLLAFRRRKKASKEA